MHISLLAATAFASPEDTPDMSLSVPGVRMITLDKHSLDFIAGGGDFDRGWTETKEITARIGSNVNWVLMISGTGDSWDGPWAKPVSDIFWKYGSGEFHALSTGGASVTSGGPVNNLSVPIHFKIKLALDKDIPGEYRYEYILMELTAP